MHDCRAAAIHTTTRFTEPFLPVVHEKAPSFTKAEHLQIFHKGRQSCKRPQVGALLVVRRVVSIGDVQQRLLRYAFYKQVVRRRFLASNLHIFEKGFGKIARAALFSLPHPFFQLEDKIHHSCFDQIVAAFPDRFCILDSWPVCTWCGERSPCRSCNEASMSSPSPGQSLDSHAMQTLRR